MNNTLIIRVLIMVIRIVFVDFIVSLKKYFWEIVCEFKNKFKRFVQSMATTVDLDL